MRFSTLAVAAATTAAVTMGVQAGPVRHKAHQFVEVAVNNATQTTSSTHFPAFFAKHTGRISPSSAADVLPSSSAGAKRSLVTALPDGMGKKKKKRSVCIQKVNKTTTTYTTTTTTQTVPGNGPTTVPSTTNTSKGGSTSTSVPSTSNGQSSCFPALNFTMPGIVPSSVDNWWCSVQDEQAWLGFSYDVSWCPDGRQLLKSFKRMRTEYKARYVRIYGACDNDGYTNEMVNAAWEAGIGVYPLIWFGFDGDDKWKTRRDSILTAIKTNPKAPLVVRGVVVGSEPMYDNVLPADQLAEQIQYVKSELSTWTNKGDTGMQVTLSEMPYGYSIRDNAPSVFQAEDVIHANILPFFDWSASTAAASFQQIQDGINYLKQYGLGKKIIISQTGWPTNTDVWKPNSAKVVASVEEQQSYFRTIDDNACGALLNAPKGGVAWFSHIYTDYSLPGWGQLTSSFQAKYPFAPRTSC